MRLVAATRIRLTAGIAGAFALPVQGAYQSMRRKITGAPQKLMREPRTALSHLDAANLSQEEKDEIISVFNKAKEKTGERRGYYKRKAEVFLMNMKKDQKSAQGEASSRKDDDEEGYTLKEGDEVGYIQEGELRKMSKEERDKMEQMEKEGYERAKAEMGEEN